MAGGQKGLITSGQLGAVGVAGSTIAYAVKAGWLHRKYRGVYAYGRPDLSLEGELLAAALAIGEDAVVSHIPAAILWGFWKGQMPRAIDITVPRAVRSRDGIRVHTAATVERNDRTFRNGVPITTPARTIADLAQVVHSDHAYRRAVHEAQSLRLVTPPQLDAILERRSCPRLKAIVADGPRPTRSELEDAVDDVLTRHGLRPPLTNTRIPGLPTWVVVDFLYPVQRLVIEADGARFHDTAIRQASDRRKQALIEAHGLRVMRLRWEDAQPDLEEETVARVRHALGW